VVCAVVHILASSRTHRWHASRNRGDPTAYCRIDPAESASPSPPAWLFAMRDQTSHVDGDVSFSYTTAREGGRKGGGMCEV
jgi:hypothetical protein